MINCKALLSLTIKTYANKLFLLFKISHESTKLDNPLKGGGLRNLKLASWGKRI